MQAEQRRKVEQRLPLVKGEFLGQSEMVQVQILQVHAFIHTDLLMNTKPAWLEHIAPA